MSCTGFEAACGIPPTHPLPKEWLGLAGITTSPPVWAKIPAFTDDELRYLLAQIAYDKSSWNIEMVGPNNELGKYQFSTQTLETYGIIAAGANELYGNDCVNYRCVWPTNIYDFLSNAQKQDFLAYRVINDLYNACITNCAIQYQSVSFSDWQPDTKYAQWDAVKYKDVYYQTDTELEPAAQFNSPPWQKKPVQRDKPYVIAGMLYVAWNLGPGVPPSPFDSAGTGAWAWRYSANGDGVNSFNSGRYAIETLSQ